MAKRRIARAELAIGTVLPWNVFDDHGRLLLRRGQTVASDTQIDALIERGLFIEDDPVRERAPEPSSGARSAVALILDARHILQTLCAPTGSKENFARHIMGVRELVRGACAGNRDAALAMALLHRVGRYSVRHSV